jgi:beta-lactamase regulating signal transducer with metallopeptidase domain
VSAAERLAGLLGELVPRLVETSLVGGGLALLVWACCRALPSLPAGLRCWLWWGVALKMLVGLLPLPAVPVPVLPATVGSSPPTEAWATSGGDSAAAARGEAAAAAIVHGDKLDAPAPPTSERRSPRERSASALAAQRMPWTAAVGGFWLLGVAVSLARATAELLRARRVARAAEPVSDPALLATFDELRRRLDVPTAELRLSRAVATPQLVGIRRPVVLLPAGVRERLAGGELAMVIGHELLHARRGDLLRGLLPALAARCFFFHPLARLAEREHSLAREAACDAAVVERLAPSPRAYGRLLLELALGGGAPLRAAAAAVTHPTLQRRLQMLLRPTAPVRPLAGWSLLLLGFCALVPLRLVARDDADPAAPSTAAISSASSRSSTASANAAEANAAAAARHRSAAAHAVAAREAAAARPAAEARTVTIASASRTAAAAGRSERSTDDDSWIYFHDPSTTTMNGSVDDVERVRRYLRGDEPLLWVRRDGKEWIVHDPALLRRAAELFAPMQELGEKQAELGGKQAELGSRQAELGGRQAELGAHQASLGSQQAALAADLARVASQRAALAARSLRAKGAEVERLEREADELERQVQRLDPQVHELSARQQELGRKQGELGSRQGELGAKQAELGAQQGALGGLQAQAALEADRGVAELIEEAIRTGLAIPPP